MRSKTSKPLIVLLGLVLVLLIRGTREQRRMMRRLRLVGLHYPGQDLVNGIGGFFGGVGGGIRQFVETVVNAALTLVWDGIDGINYLARAAWDHATDVLNIAQWLVSTAVNNLTGYINSLTHWAIDTAAGFARSLYDAAIGFAHWVLDTATNLAHSLYDAAIGFGHWVLDTALSVAHGLFDTALNFGHWVLDTVSNLARSLFDTAMRFGHWVLDTASSLAHGLFDAATGLARTLFDTANSLIGSAIDSLNHAIMHTITEVENRLGDQVSTVNDYLFGAVQTLVNVVSDVVDWLIGLATFPFSTARDMWAAMRTTGGQTVRAHMPGMVDRWGDRIAEHARDNAGAGDKGFRLAPLPVHTGPGTTFGGGGGAVGGGTGTPDLASFARDLLDALGAPATETNIGFLRAWFAHESTAATFNPLATTLDYGENTRFNSVGVRNFPTMAAGVAATAATLTSGLYPRIVADLRTGDGHAAGLEHDELRTWSGGGYDTVAA